MVVFGRLGSLYWLKVVTSMCPKVSEVVENLSVGLELELEGQYWEHFSSTLPSEKIV